MIAPDQPIRQADRRGPFSGNAVDQRSAHPRGDVTFLRIPGTLCDDKVWHKLDWPASWTFRDASLADCDNLEAAAARLLSSSSGQLVPMGFSMGGMIALEMARQAPDRCAGLVLIGTNHLADKRENLEARTRHLARMRLETLSVVVGEDLIARYFAGIPSPDDRQSVLEMALSAGPEAMTQQYGALAGRRDNSETLLKYDGPVLVITGGEDRMCPHGQQAAMAGLARYSTFHSLGGVGHMVPLEAPQSVMRVLKQWASTHLDGLLCPTAS